MPVAAYLESNEDLRKDIMRVITDQIDQLNILEAPDYKKFVSLFPAVQPEVIIQSVYEDMQRNQEELLLTLRNLFPSARIIICEQPHAEFNLLSYFHWGACAILCPGDLKFDMVQCMSSVLAGERFLGNEATSRILENIPDLGWL